MADGMASMKDTSAIQRALGKAGSFFKSETVKPVLMGVAGGGVGVIVIRYVTKDWFRKKNADGTFVNEYTTDAAGRQVLTADAKNARYMRAAAKVALGLGAAQVLKKYSPVVALGVAIGAGVDAVADLGQVAGFEMMDRWFNPPRTASGMYGGGGMGGGRLYTANVS